MKLKDETKRHSIIEKTIDIVFEKGFAGVKMAELARKVGISPSTLYVYYKNKEDLIVSIAIELIERETKRSSKEVIEELPYKLKLKALWLYWIDFSINHSKEMSFLQQLKQSPYYGLVPKKVKEKKFKLGFDLFELGKKEGLIKNVDNDILASTIGAVLSETVKLIIAKRLKLNQKDTDLMFSFVWDAIKS